MAEPDGSRGSPVATRAGGGFLVSLAAGGGGPDLPRGVRGPFPHKVGCLFPITVIALKMCVFGCLWDVLAGRICHAIAGRVTN